MKITIADWSRGKLLEKTPYREQVTDGDEADVLRIAGDLFKRGLNVMLLRAPRPEDGIFVWVDDHRFNQR